MGRVLLTLQPTGNVLVLSVQSWKIIIYRVSRGLLFTGELKDEYYLSYATETSMQWEEIETLAINTTSNEAVTHWLFQFFFFLPSCEHSSRWWECQSTHLTSHCMVISSANEDFWEYFLSYFSRMETSIVDLILCWLYVIFFFKKTQNSAASHRVL